jgi:hypothetical protein
MRTAPRTAAGAVSAAAAAALLLSGCSGSDDSSAGSQDTGRITGTAAAQGRYAGVWDTKVVSKHFVLAIAGKNASLLRGDQKTCTGSFDGAKSITLKCPASMGDNMNRGTVVAADAKALTVRWNGGETDRFLRVADAPKRLPREPQKLQALIPGG